MENLDTDNKIVNDKEIIERIVNGEKELFEVLMRKYNSRLFRICMSFINDETEAQDIMQTTYLKAYSHLSGFNYNSSFSTWITRILINECLAYRKRQAKQKNTQLPEETKSNLSDNPFKDLINKELRETLESAIYNLPQDYKFVFVMREIEEMSTKETGDVLSLSEANVKTRLFRAKEMLRASLKEYYNLKDVFKFDLRICDKVVSDVMGKI